ncbi:MAG: DUF3179 domain-containing (seleno)protein [Kribbellaceae bacterium]
MPQSRGPGARRAGRADPGGEDFRAAHPEAWTLSRVTGHDRDYGRNPYLGYDEAAAPLFDAPGDDPRLAPLERIVAITGRTETVAVLREAVADRAVYTITLDGRLLVVWHRRGQASALDAERVAAGRDIGTVAVFDPVVDARRLSFRAATGTAPGDQPGDFVDRQTGTHWNVLGHAVDGPLAGRQLAAYPFIDTFWFTWVAFRPDTRLVR